MGSSRTHYRPRAELAAMLQTQIGFLERSASAYDAGFEDEAVRLAVTIRLMLSDSGRGSQALLRQLGLRDRLAFVDTSLSHRGLRPDHPGFNAGLAAMEILPGRGGRYVALLDRARDGRRQPRVPFGMWWSKRIYRGMSRADLVAALANQEGGAHVDPALTDAYADLTRRNSLGWEYADSAGRVPFEGNAAKASMRQLTWELLTTLHEQVSPDAQYIGPEPPPRRNDPCPCGSGDKFKKCCGA